MTTVGPGRPHTADTGVPREVPIPDEPLTAALDRAALRWPDRVAVDFLGEPTTYAELADAVARGAQVLLDLGVKPGDRVALVMPNCTGHVVAFYAALRIGAVVVEHNPTYTAGELAHQLADSGAVVALVWEKAVPRVLETLARTSLKAVVAMDLSADLPRGKRIALHLPVPRARRLRQAMCGKVPPAFPMWHRLVAKAAPLDPAHPVPSASDVALLQYTGGTTGTPKGAMLTHRNLVANAVQGHAWTGVEPGTDVVYGVLPFFHAFGLTLCLTYAVRVGATMVAFPSFDPAMVLDAQQRLPGTFLPAVPPMLDRLATAAEASGADLTSFRYAISGAMALPAATAQKWERVTGGLVSEGYGMTETSPVALGNPLTDRRRPGTLGLPFPSTHIRVVDPTDVTREVEPGERGELLIQGPQVFAGYWGRPEETAEQLLDDGWLRTGDIVTVDETGWVVLVDRIKEVIVSGGFKVYPSQVEDHLRGMPGVADVAVVGVPGGDLGETVVAAVVLEPGAHGVDLDAIRAWGERHLARYALPRRLVVLEELPRSQVGKVLRRVVRDSVLAG
ncbi:AMP-binding protein [uncultured Cellulomonas sp.]|uniref:AMP-binding protein n=1 Tax=uncultured Cellulomonas sp. TaxID=189682 RepID=UPI0028EA8135|nr:AMP-binding protein [uncultured Cellulomonas sp.]